MVTQNNELDTTLRQRVYESMPNLLVRILRRDVTVTEDMRLMEELGLSSSAGLELLLELEEELEIQIDIEELDQDETQTVGDLADYIAGHSIPR